MTPELLARMREEIGQGVAWASKAKDIMDECSGENGPEQLEFLAAQLAICLFNARRHLWLPNIDMPRETKRILICTSCIDNEHHLCEWEEWLATNTCLPRKGTRTFCFCDCMKPPGIPELVDRLHLTGDRPEIDSVLVKIDKKTEEVPDNLPEGTHRLISGPDQQS